jgi:hypothetical protein
MAIEVMTGFDGSCPQSDVGIRRESDRRVTIFPGRRRGPGADEEVAGKGSRLNVRLVNPGVTAEEFTALADWERPDRVEGHDLGFVRHETEAEWRMIPGLRVDDARIEYRLRLPPGVTHLGLYPEFNCADVEAMAAELAARGAQVETAGRSREGREIRLIAFPSPNARARNCFVQTRDHAYETAGSYCARGIAEFLLSGAPMAEYLRAKFNVFIAPMTNPDGVHNGMSRLTWERGADLNRLVTVPDPAHNALRAALDRVKPDVYMNVHNWTDKFTDGLLVNEAGIAEKIQLHMPADAAHAKRWWVEVSPRYLPDADPARFTEATKSWKNYCRERFGATAATFEFPWFGLTTAEMRRKGERAFTALALAAIEERKF